MAQRQIIDRFIEAWNAWRELSIDKAARSEFGDKGLPELRNLAERLTGMLEVMGSVVHQLSTKTLQEIDKGLREITRTVRGLAQLDEAQFFSNKQRLFQDAQNQFETIAEHYPAALILFRSTQPDLQAQDYERRMREITEQTQKEFLNLRVAFEEQVNQLTAANAVKKGSLISQEKVFIEEANLFRKRADGWAIGIVVLSVGFFVLLYCILRHFCFELSCYTGVGEMNYNSACPNGNCAVLYLEIGKAIAYRVLVVSFGLFIISVAVRNYYAAMHNYTINKHKANSLAAALTMMNLKLSPTGGDNIMQMAAAAIFSHQATGYNKRDPQNIISSLMNTGGFSSKDKKEA